MMLVRDGDIWLAPERGPEARLACADRSACANSDAVESEPVWSPDGARVAFTTTRNGNSDVYVADANGGHAVPIAKTNAEESAPAWSPDATELAFESDAAGSSDVYRTSAQPGGRTQRVTFSSADDGDPTWSPDGAEVAFASNRAAPATNAPADADTDLFATDLTASIGGVEPPVRQLTDTPASEASPDWSRNGGAIALSSDAAGDSEIFVLDVGTRELRQVTDSAGSNEAPAWAGRSPEIVFQSDRPQGGQTDFEIYTIEPDSSGEQQLTDNGVDDMDAYSVSSSEFTVDNLDAVDDPAPCTNGTDGPRVEVDYLLPTNHSENYSLRTDELRNVIKTMDRLLNYSTGPWRDQDWRWYCVNNTHVINWGSGIPSVSGGVNHNDLETWLDANSYEDGNLHVGFVELKPGECIIRDNGACSTFYLDAGGGGTNAPFESPEGWAFAYVNANHAEGTSRRDFTVRHEAGHAGLGARDIYSLNFNPDYGDDDEMDLMAKHASKVEGNCARPQMDCGKEEWFSSLKAHTGVNPSWTGQFQNSALSVYLTPPAGTSQTVYCVGTVTASTPRHDEAADNFQGTSVSNVVSMLDQNDIADGYGGDDRLCGGDGADTLRGGEGNDHIVGSGGIDTLNGGDGNDHIYDGWGPDQIDGGAGSDVLYQCNDGTFRDDISNVEDIRPISDSYCRSRNFEI